MRVHNKRFALRAFGRATCQTTGKAAALSSMLVLAACADTGLFGGGPGTSNAGPAARMQSNAEAALCAGNASEAIRILTAEPLGAPTDRFFLALAVEESGGAPRARGLYTRLMQSGSTDQIYVNCGGRLLANGSVSNEAARRLADISRDLAVLDVNMRPSASLHAGLPYSEKPASRPTNSNNSYSGPALAITRPTSQSPLGQWFVHLASYRSMEAAVENRSTVERQFPAFAGIIDQWEVNVSGLAVRLGVRVSDRTEANNLCTAVKSNGAYCAVLNTTQ